MNETQSAPVDVVSVGEGAANRLGKLKTIRDIVLLVVVLASLAALALVFLRTDSQAEENFELIRDLRSELAASAAQVKEAVALVEANRVIDAEQVECITRFTYAIQLAEGEIISAQSLLTTAIATTGPNTPERQQSAENALVRLGEAQAAYDLTVKQRIEYDVSGNPLPCALPPGLNEG